jgi:methylisocitrate lyase
MHTAFHGLALNGDILNFIPGTPVSRRAGRREAASNCRSHHRVRSAHGRGYRISRLYLSGGGVAANALGLPDLGISTMDDVLIDASRIVEATTIPLLVDIDTGWGGAFNIARTIRSMIRTGVAAVHIEDQVSAKRCGHRPGKEIVATEGWSTA